MSQQELAEIKPTTAPEPEPEESKGCTPPAILAPFVQPFQAQVAGNICEKIFYYSLLGAAGFLFIFSSISVVVDAPKQNISSVSFVKHDTFQYPGMFFCTQKNTGTDDKQVDFTPDGTSGAQNRDSEVVKCTNNTWWAKRVYVNSKLTKKTCIAHDDQTSATIKARNSTLANYMATVTPHPSWDCQIFNDKGLQTAKSGTTTAIAMVADVKAREQDNLFMIAGFYDTALTNKDLFKKNFRYYFVNMHNSLTDISFTMDINIDLTHTGMHFVTPKAKNYPKEAVKVYLGQVNQAPFEYLQIPILKDNTGQNVRGIRKAGGSPEKDTFYVQFTVASYIGRQVVSRKKSFTEVWAEVGGVWASSLLIVIIFFSPNAAIVGTGVTKNAHMLRLRGLGSKQALLEQFSQANSVKDACTTTMDNARKV